MDLHFEICSLVSRSFINSTLSTYSKTWLISPSIPLFTPVSVASLSIANQGNSNQDHKYKIKAKHYLCAYKRTTLFTFRFRKHGCACNVLQISQNTTNCVLVCNIAKLIKLY